MSRSAHTLLAESQSWSAGADPYRPGFVLDVDDLDAYLLGIRGQDAAAEPLYENARQTAVEALNRYDPALKGQGENYLTRLDQEQIIDSVQIALGASKVRQRRAQEGEVDIREALLRILKRDGKDHDQTGAALSSLGFAMLGEGRYEDAESLTRAALDIYHAVGLRDETPRVVATLQQLAQSLEGEKKTDEAQKIDDQIDGLVALWDPAPREAVMNETPRLKRLIVSGQAVQAADLAGRKLERERARSGDDSQATAVVRGYLASALAKSGAAPRRWPTSRPRSRSSPRPAGRRTATTV